MPSYYEFFAGGGMARAGLGDDWKCLLANDICEKKASSYVANWGSDHLIVGDIYDLRPSDLPGRADLAWGSFPCQDLSIAGQGAGLDGHRSGAFWGYWNLIRGLNRQGRKPQTVVLENVFGALTSRGGSDFEAIIRAVASQNYRVGAMVIDAVHFLPQSRPRLFIVAVDKALTLPESATAVGPTPAWHPAALIKAFNQLPADLKKSWIWWMLPAPDQRLKTLDDLVEAEPQGVVWHTEDETEYLLGMMAPTHMRKVIAAQAAGHLTVGTIYRRMRDGVQRAEVRFEGISGCLRTPGGGSSRQTIIVVKGETVRTRLLSPREAARLMGLDDSYRLPDRYNDAYRLAGDGVAVPVVRHIAHNLLTPVLQRNEQARKDAA